VSCWLSVLCCSIIVPFIVPVSQIAVTMKLEQGDPIFKMYKIAYFLRILLAPRGLIPYPFVETCDVTLIV
jgi:hypothetical protein